MNFSELVSDSIQTLVKINFIFYNYEKKSANLFNKKKLNGYFVFFLTFCNSHKPFFCILKNLPSLLYRTVYTLWTGYS